MRKFNILMISGSAMMLALMSGCGQSAPAPTKSVTEAVQETAVQTTAAAESEKQESQAAASQETKAHSGDAAVSDGSLTGPYLVTTCGQSPGAVMVNMVAVQAGLTSANDNTLTAEKLSAADCKTLIVTTGTSMKGMGAAGTDVNAEIERCQALMKAAKEEGITVVGAHVEGMARRADSSDTASIEAVLELSDVILVIDESDSDGYFTDYAKEHNKPLLKAKDSLDIASVLK